VTPPSADWRSDRSALRPPVPLTRLRGIERGILLAAQCFARELDQMMADEAHRQRRVDLAAPRCLERSTPERAAIVGQ
jgi:hypothetical protein